MMTLFQLRQKYRPTSPVEVLEDLANILRQVTDKSFSAPLLTIVTNSGYSFRGYLINSSGTESGEKSFLFSIEMVNQGDGANDIIFIQGSRIESLTVWNVDDYKGILPRFKKTTT